MELLAASESSELKDQLKARRLIVQAGQKMCLSLETRHSSEQCLVATAIASSEPANKFKKLVARSLYQKDLPCKQLKLYELMVQVTGTVAAMLSLQGPTAFSIAIKDKHRESLHEKITWAT